MLGIRDGLAAVLVLGLAATPALAQTSTPSTNGTVVNPPVQAAPSPSLNNGYGRAQPSTMPDQVGGGTTSNPSQAQVPRTPSDLDRQDHRGTTIRPITQGGGSMAPAPGQTALFNSFEDAIECNRCGGRMVRAGTCYTCRDCGTSTGCG